MNFQNLPLTESLLVCPNFLLSPDLSIHQVVPLRSLHLQVTATYKDCFSFQFALLCTHATTNQTTCTCNTHTCTHAHSRRLQSSWPVFGTYSNLLSPSFPQLPGPREGKDRRDFFKAATIWQSANKLGNHSNYKVTQPSPIVLTP